MGLARKLNIAIDERFADFAKRNEAKYKAFMTAKLDVSDESLKLYSDLMEKSLSENESYLSPTEFNELHQKHKTEAIEQFGEKSQLNGHSLELFKTNLDQDIEEKSFDFKKQNGDRNKESNVCIRYIHGFFSLD